MKLARLLLAVLFVAPALHAVTAIGSQGQADRTGFEENRGQLPPDVRFSARAEGFDLYLTTSDLRVALREPPQAAENGEPAYNMLQLAFTGATGTTHPRGLRLLDDRTTYIRSAEQQIQRVPTFERVKYCDIYPSIDLEVYRANGAVEFDFIVHPGGDPAAIRLDVGMASADLDPQGDLLIRGPEGFPLRVRAPKLYQMVDGKTAPVDGVFEFKSDGAVGFAVGSYDLSQTLIIDPVLNYATYISGNKRDTARAVFVDPQKNVYVTGGTESPDLPTTGTPAFGTLQGKKDVFVVKYNSMGTRLFATYLGGTENDEGFAITADHAGFVYVAGDTSPGWDSVSSSLKFPVTAGAYTSHPYESAGVLGGADSFVTKFTPDGSSMVFSAMVAGSHRVETRGIAIDAQQNVTVAGKTSNPSAMSPQKPFPTTPNAYDRSASLSDAFIYQLNASGAQLRFSTFFGGSGAESVEAVAVDRDGNVVIGGSTVSTDLPVTPDALFSTFVGPLVPPPPSCPTCGPKMRTDGYVAKISSDGRRLLYGSYIRGGTDVEENDNDSVTGLALETDGSLYIAGETFSTNFATTEGAFQTSFGFGFLLKLDPANAVSYSTYLPAGVTALAVNGEAAYITGSTVSTTFPTMSPTQATNAGSTDAVLMRLNATGSALEFSTYLGGSGSDTATALAVDANGNAYVVGTTSSTNFPTTANAAQPSPSPDQQFQEDSFLAIFVLDADGDGLLDPWETSGFDVDGDGTIDLNLAALGATPDHKDLFVEVDFMTVAAAQGHTHDPRLAPDGTTLPTDPIQQVIAAFAGAPVTNPDGQTGIRLHVLIDENLPEQATVTFRGAGSGFDAIKRGSPPNPCDSGRFGTAADRSNENCAKILRAKRLVYRYAIFGHEFSESVGSSGTSELPGNDFLVTHRLRDPVGTDFERAANTRSGLFGTTFEHEWTDMVAGTFMHELGHTLRLTHGGAPADGTINCKPNYLSVMNYSRQHNSAGYLAGTTTVAGVDRVLDYSRSALPALNEAALSESAGVGGQAGERFGYGEGVSGAFRIQDAANPTDWNGQNGIDTNPVAADINFVGFLLPSCGASPNQTLNGFNDWNGLLYSFRSSRDYDDGVSRQTAEINELTDEQSINSVSLTEVPNVTITTPAGDARFSNGASIPINVTAVDPDGTVSAVHFFGDGVLLAEDTTMPYTFTWTSPAEGTHKIKVRAVDDRGAIGSASINVHAGCNTFLTSSQAIPYDSTEGALQISLGSACSWNTASDAEWLTVAPASGTGEATLAFAAEENPTGSSRSATVTVNEAMVTITQDPSPPFGAPSGLTATAVKNGIGQPQIALSWDPVANANYYEVSVKYPSSTYTDSTTDRALIIPPSETYPNTAFLFKVRAISASAQVSAYSAPELATVVFFTDDPIVAQITATKAIHITELRSAVNAVRTLAGLAAATFPTNVAPGVPIAASPITELRTALEAARSTLGLPGISYTDPMIGAGTFIKRAHIQEIRDAIE